MKKVTNKDLIEKLMIQNEMFKEELVTIGNHMSAL